MAKFKFAAIANFWTAVKVTTPNGDVQEFQGQFVYLDDKQWAEKGQLHMLDFLRQHWIGWTGIAGADDQEIPFSEDQREVFLGHNYISSAVLAAYNDARAGQRAKN
jgi:hypothetical protein